MVQATQPQVSPQEILLQMTTGYWLTQALAVAARLGVADRLVDGPHSVEELAPELGAHPDGLYRLLRALSGVGIFAEAGPRSFALTPLSEFLRTDAPGSMRDFVMMNGNPSHYHSWSQLESAVRTNRQAFEQAFGTRNVFEFFAKHPDEAKVFNGAMSNMSATMAAPVAQAYDFKGIGRLCDVGGGHGTLIGAVLKAHPTMRGVLYDRPEVVAGAPKHDRLEAVGGDFFQGVPGGCDAYMMKHILHDWSDEQAAIILGHCAKALAPGGKVLIVEIVLPEGPGEPFGKLMDLNMLVMCDGGKERTAAQFRALLATAGLQLQRVVRTNSPMSVVEAVKA